MTLHLADLWSKRRSSVTEPADRTAVIQAARSGELDAATEEKAVLLLLADPDFINTLWQRGDPAKRNLIVGRLLKKIANDSPGSLWSIIDDSDFTLSRVSNIAETINLSVAANPLNAFECISRNKSKIGPDAVKTALSLCASNAEGARALLSDVAAGGKYSEDTLRRAFEVTRYYEGGLPPEISRLPMAQAVSKKEEEQKMAGEWLKGNTVITPENLRAIPAPSFKEALLDAIWTHTTPIGPDRFEQLAAAGRKDDQKFLLSKLIQSGRTEEAIGLLEATKDMPGTRTNSDALVVAVASSIYESGADVGRAVTLLNGISDEKTYWRSVKNVLSSWAKEDPVAARAYLPNVEDPQIRAELQKITDHSSISP